MKRCVLGLLCLFISIQSFAQSLESDRLALVAIYTATSTGINEVYGGPNFNDITDWNVPGSPGDSPCGWEGVTCEGGRVTRLDLSQNQVHGPIAPEIGNLTELKYLNLESAGSEFFPWTGNVPTSLGNLTKLEYLNLRHDSFSITSMGVIGNLTGLKELAVTPLGEIPSEWAALVNLEVLFMGSDEAFPPSQGFAFPTFLTGFTKLRELYLISQLTGTFPAQVGNIANLEVLEIKRNYNLTGQISSGIGNLSNLKKLSITNHFNINGQIPGEIGNLNNLEVLELSGNKLTGTIPSSLSLLANLKVLDLSSNVLTGTIPAVTNFTKLTEMDLSYNRLESMIPDLSAIPIAANVNIANNRFTFSGMESNVAYLDIYSPQKEIEVFSFNGLPPMAVYASAGGTPSNIYKWYFKSQLIATLDGTSYGKLLISEKGLYRVEVTNTKVPGLTLGGSVDVTSLPVTLVSFEGKSENNQTKLTWKTSSETNNKGFEIERSADARAFETIGFVDGNGDTKESNTYHFTDLAPFRTSYYRLKQLDYDGKSEYSRVIAVRGEYAVMKVYPNPAQNYLVFSGINQKQPFSIIDGNGRVVIEGLATDMGQIDIRSLGTGQYVVRVGTESSKLLINR